MLVRRVISQSTLRTRLIIPSTDRSFTRCIDRESLTPRNDPPRLSPFHPRIATTLIRIPRRYSHRRVPGQGGFQAVSYAQFDRVEEDDYWQEVR